MMKMKKAAFLTATMLATVGIFGAGSSTAPQARAAGEMVVSQLPRGTRPLSYALRIEPDAAALKFRGIAIIDVEVTSPVTAIIVNAAELAFDSVEIGQGQGAGRTAIVTLDEKAQTATFSPGETLRPGRYWIRARYTGKIYQQATGLFALDYQDTTGASKRALFTQFEAPDARRVFPGWDEPNFKTPYSVTLVGPAGQMAVSNMPVGRQITEASGKVATVFQTTPKMSSYLLFMGLGEFDRITRKVGPTEVGVIMGRGNADKGRDALDAAAQVLPYYNDYFGTPYPLPKLDNVAGPGQSQFFSAMENWGAIFSFESILLNDPKVTSAGRQQAIFGVAAHEIAHQWFGDLVTMQWWDDLWLNEGFASWMATKATIKFHPDWEAEMDRVGGRERAMSLDANATTHPVVQHVRTVDEISQAFDAITYQKGEAIITMLEAFAGEDVWRRGIQAYMKRHAYGNTRTVDLWSAVEAAGAKGLVQIARDFTNQPGIPLIRVTSSTCKAGTTRLTFTQGEFSRDRKSQTDATPRRWNVPVIAQVLGQPAARTIVSRGSGSITLQGCGTTLVNAGQGGYFRTLYTPEMTKALARDYARLAPIDQLGLANDALVLGYGGYQGVDIALDLLDGVPAGGSLSVLVDAASTYGGLYERFEDDAATRARLAARASAKLLPVVRRLGFSPVAGESLLAGVARQALIGTLGTMGDPVVLAEARRLFAKLDTDKTALDGPLRNTWLGIIAANADRPTWDKLHTLARTAESQLIKADMYDLLGSARDKALAQAALELALTSEPGATQSASIISAVAAEHPDLAVDFALAHIDKVESFVDASSRSRYLPGMAARSRDPGMIGKLETYARTRLDPQSRKPVERAISQIRVRLASEPRIKAEVRQWLAGRPN